MSDHRAVPKNEGHLVYTDTLRNYIIVVIYYRAQAEGRRHSFKMLRVSFYHFY